MKCNKTNHKNKPNYHATYITPKEINITINVYTRPPKKGNMLKVISNILKKIKDMIIFSNMF